MTSPSLDAFVRSLTSAPALLPVPVRVGWTRRWGRVRGLSVAELVDLAARHPACRDFVWMVFGLGPRIDRETTAKDAAVLFDALQVALGSRSRLTVWRLYRLPLPTFDAIMRVVVEATVPDPDDVDELFKPAGGKPSVEGQAEEDGPWRDPVVVLTNAVAFVEERMGVDVMSWTPGRVLYRASRLSERDAEIARRDLVDGAIASRLGQADKKSWKTAMAEIGGSR